jgi:hypothetical protein
VSDSSALVVAGVKVFPAGPAIANPASDGFNGGEGTWKVLAVIVYLSFGGDGSRYILAPEQTGDLVARFEDASIQQVLQGDFPAPKGGATEAAETELVRHNFLAPLAKHFDLLFPDFC